MPTANGDRLPFGQDHLIPADTRTAWGARLIVTQDGYVDFVHDRQGAAGEDRDKFLDLVNAEFPLDDLRGEIRNLLKAGRMDTRCAEDFVLHTTDTMEVHANTNASAGYCYVTAWSKGATT